MADLPEAAGKAAGHNPTVAEAVPAEVGVVDMDGGWVLAAGVRLFCFYGKSRPAGEYSGYT